MLTILKSWLMAIRVKTLSAAVVPIALCSALLLAESGPFLCWVSIFALLSSLFIQIGTNFINDAMDFRKGADTAERLGPQRVTQSGLIGEKQVLFAGLLCFAMAMLFGIPLVIQGGWVIVAIGVCSLICGYAYTGGPYPLAYRGLGDFFVVLFFGWVAVAGLYYLHTGTVEVSTWVLGTQVGFLSTVLIAINNMRDVQQDKRANKNTLAVRWGIDFVRTEILLLLLVVFGLQTFWWQQGFYAAAILPLFTLPMAFKLFRSILRLDPSPVYNLFLAQAAALQILFGLLFIVGLFLRLPFLQPEFWQGVFG